MDKPETTSNARLSAVLRDPLAQGAVVGLLTLIPVRNYPRWVRKSIIWAPMVITGVGSACFGANPQAAQTLSKKIAESESDQPEQTELPERFEDTPTPQPRGGVRGAVRVMIPGLAIGAVISGSMAVAIWADEKIDRGLRRVGVPLPRVVMGVAAGLINGVSVAQENRRDRSEE